MFYGKDPQDRRSRRRLHRCSQLRAGRLARLRAEFDEDPGDLAA